MRRMRRAKKKPRVKLRQVETPSLPSRANVPLRLR